MNRLPFLDWARGLAVVIMIQCHSFNSFTRHDLRHGGPYVLSQFVGGMAAVLFLFLAGVTFSFQMESLERRSAPPRERFAVLLRRAGYILLMGYLFRLSNWLFSPSLPGWRSLLKVDILNCMGLAMAAMALVALWPGAARARIAALSALGIAAASPLVSALDWTGVPWLLRDYITPNRALFPFFPWAAYLAFGVSVGTMLRRIAPDRLERAMQWAVLGAFGLIGGGQYFSNIPYSIYPRPDFWLNSPALVIIRLGLLLLALAIAFLWTEYLAGGGWSWMRTLGRNSMMVYWVHVMLVYGWVLESWKSSLTVLQAAAATAAVTALMVALSAGWLKWKARRRTTAARRSSAPEPVEVAVGRF